MNPHSDVGVCSMPDAKIKIVKDGPYIVTGNVPITEKIIAINNKGYYYVEGRVFPQAVVYTLCRCGHSKNMPFCDRTHTSIRFDSNERASKEPFLKNAVAYTGNGFTLYDVDELCAFARFCHKPSGDVWTLTEDSADETSKAEAIEAALDCPAGRLVIFDDKTKSFLEPDYEPSVVIIQDPERNCSGPIWVRGGIPIESADGTTYEIRNRVTLCRCGNSRNKPFCDATHVSIHFNDSK